VGLKRIAAIGDEDQDTSAGLKHTDHLTDREAVILDVLEHLMAEDQVKGRGREREALPGSIDNVRGILPGLGSALEVIFQADHVTPQGREVFHVHAHPTSIFKDASPDALASGMYDHIQSSLLSRPPHVRGFTAQGGLVEISLGHGDLRFSVVDKETGTQVDKDLCTCFLVYLCTFFRLVTSDMQFIPAIIACIFYLPVLK
jgi:hypothetical protein